MTNRRGFRRYVLSRALDGSLVLAELVWLNAPLGGREALAVGLEARRIGERLSMRRTDGDDRWRDVEVVGSTITFVERRIRHRLRLRAVDDAGFGPLGATGAGLALLARRIPVRLVDFSVSGCRLEVATPFTAGVAELEFDIDGGVARDHVSVRWYGKPSGRPTIRHLGVEFFPTPVRGDSVRAITSRMAESSGADMDWGVTQAGHSSLLDTDEPELTR